MTSGQLTLRAAALLVFLAAAAGTWIVPPNSRSLVTNRLGRFFLAARERGLIGFGESNAAASLSASTLKELLLDRRGYLHLEVEEITNRVGINSIEHRLEEVVRLAFVFNERVLLRV